MVFCMCHIPIEYTEDRIKIKWQSKCGYGLALRKSAKTACGYSEESKASRSLVPYFIRGLALWIGAGDEFGNWCGKITATTGPVHRRAWLTAESGLLPYRDYAFFHAPYLVFVYSALFRLAGETPLFSARIFSMLSGSAGIFVVFFLVKDFFRGQPGRTGFFIAVGVTLLYLLNPLTAAASGLSWNHEAMVLLMLLAFWPWHAERRHPSLAVASGLVSPGRSQVISHHSFAGLSHRSLVFSRAAFTKNYMAGSSPGLLGITGLLPMLVLFCWRAAVYL
jgi:hypothetical protein